MEKEPFIINDQLLSYKKILSLKNDDLKLQLSEKAVENIRNSRKTMVNASKKSLPKLIEANKGFAFRKTDQLYEIETKKQQIILLKSNLNGIGKAFKPETIRLIILCKILELIKGYSGVSLSSILKLVEAYNKNIIPFVPKKGGLQADIYSAALSYMVYGLMGEGRIYDKKEEKFINSQAIFLEKGYEPLILEENDLIGLISGSKAVLAQSLEPLARADNVMKNANLIYAISFEALVGNHSPFFHKIHEIRNHKGQIQCAKEISQFITDGKLHSEMNDSLFERKGRLQDAYSFRCVCQIHGIVLETLEKTKKIIERELNSVSTRPLVYPTLGIEEDEHYNFDELIIFGGNFTDVAIAKNMDRLCIAIHELGSLSDRRICRLNNPIYDKLKKDKEDRFIFNYMPLQSIVSSFISENKFLCHPSSNDVTPFSLNKGDFYCMGSLSSQKINKLLDNVERVLAIEAILSCQGIDGHRPYKSTPTVESLYSKIRKVLPVLEENSSLNENLEKVVEIIRSSDLLK